MNLFYRVLPLMAVIVLIYSPQANAYEMTLYKEVSLPSFPDMKVPIYKSPGKKGPGILFIHGNSSSSRSFIFQQLSLLGLTHRLYFLDLPGYGRASKVDSNLPLPEDVNGIPVGFPEYQVGMVEAIISVANDPDVNAQVLVGWSLGGDLTLLAQGTGLLPNTKGIVIFGTAPVGAQSPAVTPFIPPNLPGVPFDLAILPSFGFSFQFNANSPLGFDLGGQFTDPVPSFAPAPISYSPNIGTAYIRSFFNHFHRLYAPIPYMFLEDGFVRADARARASIGVVALGLLPPGGGLPDELDVLKNLEGDPNDPSDDIPIAILHGTEEALVNYDYLEALRQNGFLPTLWKNKIVKVKKAGHAIQFERPIEFNLIIRQFVDDL